MFPDMETLILIYSGCHWLAMANSFANPVIYSLLNDGFRADLIRLFGYENVWCLIYLGQKARILCYCDVSCEFLPPNSILVMQPFTRFQVCEKMLLQGLVEIRHSEIRVNG